MEQNFAFISPTEYYVPTGKSSIYIIVNHITEKTERIKEGCLSPYLVEGLHRQVAGYI